MDEDDAPEEDFSVVAVAALRFACFEPGAGTGLTSSVFGSELGFKINFKNNKIINLPNG